MCACVFVCVCLYCVCVCMRVRVPSVCGVLCACVNAWNGVSVGYAVCAYNVCVVMLVYRGIRKIHSNIY